MHPTYKLVASSLTKSRPSCLLRPQLCPTRPLQLPSARYSSSTWRWRDKKDTDISRIRRRIFYAFDPVDIPSHKPISNPFPFLHPTAIAKIPELQHVNPIAPSTNGVPWNTSFPYSLQSKYWAEAEESARNFIRTILEKRQQDVQDKFVDAVIDAAVAFAVNVAPMGNLTRMKILARAYVLIFMHDDAVESGNIDATIPTQHNESQQEHLGYAMVARDILSEDAIQGKRFLEGILSWGSLPQLIRPDTTFPTLEDYVAYRVEDVGAYPVFRSVEFASNISVTEHDTKVLELLSSLCARHYALTNDLYSYAKEVIAEQRNGEPLLNVVRVVQNLMGVSAPSAKSILRGIIWDIEERMNGEYERLMQMQDITEVQSTYARGLIIAVAGNMFFSATCSRYARVIEGSKLA